MREGERERGMEIMSERGKERERVRVEGWAGHLIYRVRSA